MGPDLAIGPQIQPHGSQQKGNIWLGRPPPRPSPPNPRLHLHSPLPTGLQSLHPPRCWHSQQDPPLLPTPLRPARGCLVSPQSPPSRSPRGPTAAGTWPPRRLRSRLCSPIRRMGWGWVHPEVHRIRMPALPSPAGCPWGSYFFFLGISFLICEKGMIIVTSSAGWLGGAGRRTADLALTPPSPPFPVFSPPLPCACTQAHPLNPHPALARTVLCPPLKRLSTPLPRRSGFKQALPRRGILAPSPGG